MLGVLYFVVICCFWVVVYCLTLGFVGLVFDGGFSFNALLLCGGDCFAVAGFVCWVVFILACFDSVLLWFTGGLM